MVCTFNLYVVVLGMIVRRRVYKWFHALKMDIISQKITLEKIRENYFNNQPLTTLIMRYHTNVIVENFPFSDFRREKFHYFYFVSRHTYVR